MKNKVPQVTIAFWIIKIAATTLGETGGDALSMTLNLGYAISTAIFFAFFVATTTVGVHAHVFTVIARCGRCRGGVARLGLTSRRR